VTVAIEAEAELVVVTNRVLAARAESEASKSPKSSRLPSWPALVRHSDPAKSLAAGAVTGASEF
jgi:hypothetical protein